MAIYMQIQGLDGNVTAKNYENWIELESFDFNVQRKLNTQPGRISNREGSKPSVSEVVISKRLDKTSSLLFGEATVGTAKPQALIHFVTTGPAPQPYLEYTLSNVIVSAHAVQHQRALAATAEPEAYPLETVNLNFDKIEMKVIPLDKDHKAQSPIPAGYDLNQAVAT
jgi:type VI secretion system secreted protein Hcp